MSRYIMYVSVRKKRLSWGGRGVQPPRWCVCVLGVVCSDVTAVLRCTSATGGFVFVLFGQRRLSSWSHGSCSVLGMWMEDDASAVLRLLRSGVRLRGGAETAVKEVGGGRRQQQTCQPAGRLWVSRLTRHDAQDGTGQRPSVHASRSPASQPAANAGPAVCVHSYSTDALSAFGAPMPMKPPPSPNTLLMDIIGIQKSEQIRTPREEEASKPRSAVCMHQSVGTQSIILLSFFFRFLVLRQ